MAPAALALDAVWPGVVAGLPRVVSYPVTAVQPPVPGEPAEAGRLREAMARTVIDGGRVPSEPVQEALRTVPRHRSAPEVNLAVPGDDGPVAAVVTRYGGTGAPISSVSVAWLQTDVTERLNLEPGAGAPRREAPLRARHRRRDGGLGEGTARATARAPCAGRNTARSAEDARNAPPG
ncbi:hypothetical protein ACIA6C_14975 [Streptomyces sp. NPDC051578]|uniref:hypothetical protein n=1 Tax=Streptomyces sp. NPDC051578 TaxID=3365662 RepID=UPI0037B42C27